MRRAQAGHGQWGTGFAARQSPGAGQAGARWLPAGRARRAGARRPGLEQRNRAPPKPSASRGPALPAPAGRPPPGPAASHLPGGRSAAPLLHLAARTPAPPAARDEAGLEASSPSPPPPPRIPGAAEPGAPRRSHRDAEGAAPSAGHSSPGARLPPAPSAARGPPGARGWPLPPPRPPPPTPRRCPGWARRSAVRGPGLGGGRELARRARGGLRAEPQAGNAPPTAPAMALAGGERGTVGWRGSPRCPGLPLGAAANALPPRFSWRHRPLRYFETEFVNEDIITIYFF